MSQKSKQITVADMAPHIHVFKYGENKVTKLSEWLVDWIKTSLNSGKIHPNDKLPLKGELACHIGVSLGTMQNVFRRVEDKGYIYSKQRLGSFINGKTTSNISQKLTSKREFAAEKIKQYLLVHNYKNGDVLISTRKLAKETKCSTATIRNAINTLISENILIELNKHFLVKNIHFQLKNIESKTLSEKITDKLRKLINDEFNDGDKFPSHKELSSQFRVSIKTIHDSLKLLSKEGLLTSKRGMYGTTVIKSVKSQELYFYEKVELKIKHFIAENCKVGTKLPPIKDFAKELNVSTKTIKKALDNLAEDGFVTSTRGRMGGTFVTDIPHLNEAYKWLAINPDYMVGS